MGDGRAELLRQLLYISRAVRDLGDPDLTELLRQSRHNNLLHGVTGLLLYVNLHFMQCIEGTPEAIGRLIANIREDSRNVEVTVLLDRPVAERSFSDWSMGFRAMSLAELREEAAFHDLRDTSELFRRDGADLRLLAVMQNQYEVAAGRWL